MTNAVSPRVQTTRQAVDCGALNARASSQPGIDGLTLTRPSRLEGTTGRSNCTTTGASACTPTEPRGGFSEMIWGGDAKQAVSRVLLSIASTDSTAARRSIPPEAQYGAVSAASTSMKL